MNWVGGARNRLNRRNDKRIQEQFFEEKRKTKQLNNSNANINQFQCSSPYLSQDFLSFKRLSNVVNQSERVLTGCKPPKMARFVDLDNVKPRAQYINIKDTSNDNIDNSHKSSILCLSKEDDAKGFRVKSVEKFKTTFEDKVDFQISVEEDPNSRYLEESIIDSFEIKKEISKRKSIMKQDMQEEKESTSASLVDIVECQTPPSFLAQTEKKEVSRESALILEPEEDALKRFEEMKKKIPFFNLFE